MTRRDTLKPDAPLVQPSPLQSLIVQDDPPRSPSLHLPSLHSLATQIGHNLAHQHAWSALDTHVRSPLTNDLLPRPLLAGLPPHRLYVHPDEQIELLKEAARTRKTPDAALEVKAEPEREWILPTRLGEKWTLRRLAAVFDALPLVPPADGKNGEEPKHNPWRTTKRIVLASADTDSTVTYYIVQDGIVKPRQN